MRIERSERFIGYSAAALAATSFAILWVPNLHHASRGVTGATYLAVGVVLAAFLGLATLLGRRALVALGALFVTVGPWGPERLFQLLYLALTLWLVVRLVLRLRAAKAEATSAPVRPPARPSTKVNKDPLNQELTAPARAGTVNRGSRAQGASRAPGASGAVGVAPKERPVTAPRRAGKDRRSRAPTKRAALSAPT